MAFHGLAPDRSSTALLILDMISDFRFPEGKQAARAALRIAPRIVQLRQRVREAGFAVLYVNDNPGKWRSDGPALVRSALSERSRGTQVAAMLKPGEEDYFILKPRHSAFEGRAALLPPPGPSAKALEPGNATSHRGR